MDHSSTGDPSTDPTLTDETNHRESTSPSVPILKRIRRTGGITLNALFDFYDAVPVTYEDAIANGREGDVAWMQECGFLSQARKHARIAS